MPPGHRHHLLHWAVERERERERWPVGMAAPPRVAGLSPPPLFPDLVEGRARHRAAAATSIGLLREREKEREGGEREREKHGRLVGG